jgi:hypothetical protein
VGWETSLKPMVALLLLSLAFFGLNVIQMRKMQFKG